MEKKQIIDSLKACNGDTNEATIYTNNGKIIINNFTHYYLKNIGSSICFYNNNQLLKSIDIKDIKNISVFVGYDPIEEGEEGEEEEIER